MTHLLTPARRAQLVTPAQMREMDRRAIEDVGLPGALLMERASLGAADALLAHLPHTRRVVTLCGGGNNGGDGYAVARILAHRGLDSAAVALSDPTGLGADARMNHDACVRLGVPVYPMYDLDDASLVAALTALATPDVWCDALLGTGLDRPVVGRYAAAIGFLSQGRPVFALDVPSGLDARTGRVLGHCAPALATATFGRVKLGQALDPARALCGTLYAVEIGLPDAVVAEVGLEATWLTDGWSRGRLPPRPLHTHKGAVGKVLCVAGSHLYTGAALLCARAASEAGAGLVTLATHARVRHAVAASSPEVMPLAILDASSCDRAALHAAIEQANVLVCGPGLSTSAGAHDALAMLLDHGAHPLVLDADALNLIAEHDALRDALRARTAPTAITPHPGEAARLLARPVDAVTGDPVAAARDLARDLGVTAIVKGGASVIASPDGRLAVNSTGNPGMASGGMGDALAGVLAARLGEVDDLFEACCQATWAHGRAGDLARDARGTRGVTASSLIDHLHAALRGMEA